MPHRRQRSSNSGCLAWIDAIVTMYIDESGIAKYSNSGRPDAGADDQTDEQGEWNQKPYYHKLPFFSSYSEDYPFAASFAMSKGSDHKAVEGLKRGHDEGGPLKI